MTTPTFEEIAATTADENATAITEYGQAAKVKTMFKDGIMYAGFNDGTVLSASFNVSLDDFEQLADSELAPMDQFRAVLRITGGKTVAEKLMKRNAAEANQFMQAWFDTFEKLQNITLGE